MRTYDISNIDDSSRVLNINLLTSLKCLFAFVLFALFSLLEKKSIHVDAVICGLNVGSYIQKAILFFFVEPEFTMLAHRLHYLLR